MDEILKKLLESDVLSEETKATLQEQFKAAVDAYLVEERAKVEQEVTTRLTEEFVKAREELVEQVNSKLDTVVEAEFTELRGDIEQYRDLEVEFAEKLVEEKEQLAVRFGEEMEELVNKLDMFLEQQVEAEFEELKEDIAEVKRLEFGRKIVEAFEAEYKRVRQDDSAKIAAELAEANDKLADARKQLAEIERARIAEARQTKMDELLAPLTGTTREQMKIILNNVSTEKLDEAFKTYLGRVLKESSAAVTPEAKPKAKEAAPLVEGKVVTGNEGEDRPQAKEIEDPSSNASITRMRMLAGLVKP